MKAIICHALGPPEAAQLEDWPVPPMIPGSVRVAVKAAAVNYPDMLMVAGGYQFKPPLPFIPGMEAAGEVTDIADPQSAETPLSIGDPVMVQARFGAFAEQIVVPAPMVRPLPAGFTMEQGAAFRVGFQTAAVALMARGHLAEGETLLVHGAAGGVGLAAVALGKALGATVIATIGPVDAEAKAAAVQSAGADHVILRADTGFRDHVKALTDGAGADVIYDPVGGDVFDESMRCIAWGGRLLVIGFTSGRRPIAKVNHVLIKGCSVVGVRAGEFGRQDPAAAERVMTRLLALTQTHALRPHICDILPLSDAAAAMQRLADRRAIGKIVLRP